MTTMPRHTGEQWALEAGEEPESEDDLEWCPTCADWSEVGLDGECPGCGTNVDDEEPHWVEDVHMEREHEREGEVESEWGGSLTE